MQHNTTRNFFLIFYISALCCSSTVFSMSEQEPFIPATISYGQAIETDISDLLSIMDNYNEDDTAKLLVLPEPFRTASLTAAITKRRIFVARDTRLPQGNNIVSFVKVFVINDIAEKHHILGEELRIIQTDTHGTPNLIECGYFKAKYNENRFFDEVYNFRNQLGKTIAPHTRNFETRSFTPHVQQTILYLGSAYTIPQKGNITYRGHGISTTLEKKALKFIHRDITNDIRERNSTEVIMLYGLVEANKETLVHARDFMTTMQYVRSSMALPNFNINSQAFVDYYMYRAYKPAFTLDENGILTILPDDHEETQQGYGCLLKATLYDYKKNILNAIDNYSTFTIH